MQEEHELELQKVVHNFISDPAKIYNTKSGKRLQILSPGRINVHPGPDFLDIGILLDGMVIIGDAEFHKKSSLWQTHKHNDDDNYKSVILHIVFEDDLNKTMPFETLIINQKDIIEFKKNTPETENKIDLSSIDALQHYALLRLLRKASDAQRLINQNGIEKALILYSKEYLLKYYERRRRPVYDSSNLVSILNNIPKSKIYDFIDTLIKSKIIPEPEIIYDLMKSKIADEGDNLRRELILNSIIPISLCVANDDSRINIFLWYWSTPSLSTYGILKRKYPDLPQKYLWQQQGMLEYIREHGRRPNIIAESITNYGFAQVLHFYRLGTIPLAMK